MSIQKHIDVIKTFEHLINYNIINKGSYYNLRFSDKYYIIVIFFYIY